MSSMLPLNVKDPLAKTRLLAGAQAIGVVAFMIIAWGVTTQFTDDPGGLGPLGAPIPGIFVLVAALLLVAAPLVERSLLRPSPEKDVEDDGVGRYVVAKTASYAMREVAGLLGGLLILFGELAIGLGVGIASLLTMAIAWPRAGDLASRPADLDDPGTRPVEPR